jgi:putative addiction module antidote
MIDLKVHKIGDSLGVILPQQTLDRLHVHDGDRLFLIETPDGYRLTPYDPEFEQQMRLAEEGMMRYHNTLRVLAK